MINIDFLTDASNVYRTKNFIVKQNISLHSDNNQGILLLSNDTFFVRNKERNKQYNKVFQKRKFLDGKRLHSTSYTRKYVK